uniref:Predicted protein n=1 Tax=Physcomitrium patens TaxID=3218 RepID=A9U569_PHYPA
MEHGWAIRAANNTRGELYGACPDVKIRIGDVATEQHFFVQDKTSYPLILEQPYTIATWMETNVLDDGSAYARRDYGGTKEEVLLRDEGAFDASFIDILENGNIMYKKVDDFKRKERERLYDIEGQLRKLGTLQDDERILGVYEENGLEDSLELITSIGLGNNDKIVEIHSREVYTILESFQAPEVTVETRYKTADKKVKPVVGPLLEDSKEQMGEASKEASLRDPMSIGHQFTEETFEELKIGSDGYVQRCIWCDDASHARKDCNEFNNMIRQGIIYWKDRKIALKNKEDLLQTSFGKERLRALVQDYLKEHETSARESASYGARVDDDLGGSTETGEFWASAISTMQEGKLPREALLRTAATIRSRTGWEDPVESLSVHAYIAKSQHEALMEEKRRGNFDDTREGNSFKRQTRGDKAREAALQELHVKDTSASLEEKTTETKDKGKSIAYKLLSDIEAATNLKGVLKERILNAKVEFTLKEVLGIAKMEFHDVIIDSIKRKRQLMGEIGMSHAIDARIYKDEEEVDIGYKQPTNEKNGYNQRAVLFSVPFQGTLFSVNGFLKGFLGGVSGGDSSKGQGMHMDPSIASLFQAFSLSMQQQQSNDRKEALATKALQAVVNKIDQFDGRNISRYLRCYVHEMELNRVSEKKMVALFGLATISEIRDHITSITDRYENSWEVFSHALKDKYFLEDVDRVTKKLFLEWIERPNKNLQAT